MPRTKYVGPGSPKMEPRSQNYASGTRTWDQNPKNIQADPEPLILFHLKKVLTFLPHTRYYIMTAPLVKT